MKFLSIFFFLMIFSATLGFGQVKFPVEYRVEKQAMSTPMTPLDEIIFLNSYHTRPVNVEFDGTRLQMFYDNRQLHLRKEVALVAREVEEEDGELYFERYIYTDKNIASDTIQFVVDYEVGYVQVILPSKNSKGENIGYTSYRQFVKNDQLVLR
ncbi:MAG: hypothetical protein JXR22_13155 [Prolixibacteraceae bacterium]|nr:hypothetical protein [Prolixibacteraceae bacterium]